MRYRQADVLKHQDAEVFFEESELLSSEEMKLAMSSMSKGNFAFKAMILNVNYNWEIVKDADGELILVATRE